MKQFLTIIFFTLTLLFAQENLTYEEDSIFEDHPQEKTQIVEQNSGFALQNIPTSDEDEISLDESESFANELTIQEPDLEPLSEEEIEQIEYNNRYFTAIEFEHSTNQTKNIYPKFVDFPKTVYENQRFAIDIELLVTTTDFTRIKTRFIGANDISLINPENNWEELGDSKYRNIYFFKAHSKELVIPDFQILLYKDDTIVDAVFLNAPTVNYVQIAVGDEQFSNVIADNLRVLSTQTRQYSNNELLTVLELEAINGNIEDFRLQEYDEQFLMSIEEDHTTQKLEYNVILPIHKKELKFSYYNTKTNNFEQIVEPIKLEEALISTQTDLNPNESNIEIYKKIAIGFVAIFFLLLFIIKRKNIYIVIAIAVSLLFFFFVKPNSALIIEENTKIYILPTNNSTVFYITPKKQIVEILDKKDNFSKIIFKIDTNKNTNIGWIKDGDIIAD